MKYYLVTILTSLSNPHYPPSVTIYPVTSEAACEFAIGGIHEDREINDLIEKNNLKQELFCTDDIVVSRLNEKSNTPTLPQS